MFLSLNTFPFSDVCTQAELGRYSYIVRLNEGTLWNDDDSTALQYPYCGGSLVAPDVIVTAAVSFRFRFVQSYTEFIRS
jgi:secreted trypsin-like serine protease